MCWQDLAHDLVRAIDQLETQTQRSAVEQHEPSILLTVEPGMTAIRLAACRSDGVVIPTSPAGVRLGLGALAAVTDRGRDDGTTPANASIDRAVSKAAAEMMSWSKDPETFKLVERRRFTLFLAWPDGTHSRIDELAYGLWDE